jgi:hypothetical protein
MYTTSIGGSVLVQSMGVDEGWQVKSNNCNGASSFAALERLDTIVSLWQTNLFDNYKNIQFK